MHCVKNTRRRKESSDQSYHCYQHNTNTGFIMFYISRVYDLGPWLVNLIVATMKEVVYCEHFNNK